MDPEQNGMIFVKICGLRNENGVLHILLFDSSDGFPKEHDKSFALHSVDITADSVAITLKNIPIGTYAIAVLHDENGNNKLDNNILGVPKEGVAVSNNVKSKFRSPKFKDAKFQHILGKTELKLKMQYFF